MNTWWHIIKSTDRFGTATLQRVWDEERAAEIVTAGYGNAPDGPGRARLGKYARGDRLLAYAPGFGAIGVAEVVSDGPLHEPRRSRDDHAHRRAVKWLSAVADVADAVPPHRIRSIGGYTPRTLATRIKEPVASELAALVTAAADGH